MSSGSSEFAGSAGPAGAPTGGTPTGRPPAPKTAREMLELARGFLERKGLGEARLEAEILVGHALGLDRLGLFMRLDQPIQASEVDAARDLLVRRGRREPTAYIVGRREFFGRDFAVGAGVLVPRPETELIIDRGREWAQAVLAERGNEETAGLRILDVGTGSGCLAVTLALEIEGSSVQAIDLSDDALAWARTNAESLGADVRFHAGDGLEVAREIALREGPFDLVVSNPPYVEPSEREILAPEVREHEPPLALYAPAHAPDFWVQGLFGIREELLAPGNGRCLVELGHLQATRLLGWFEGQGASLTVHEDLAGIPRVAEFGAQG
ncbi:MAG: peptide chain release factor N(5)-glutamine methyltransferase [Planctomycetota bacterium]